MNTTVLITGTSSGFGKLTAITLAQAGYTVIAGMRGSNNKNEAAAQELAAIPNIDVVEIDVTNDASVTTAVEQVLAKYGKIDVLVNNAGISGHGLLEAYSLDNIKQLFEVNYYGVIRTYQAVLPSMRAAKSGLIINITTGASGHTLPFMIPYFSSKLAVESITEGLQDELRQFNIENVSIQPGVYPTEMNTGVKMGINADKPEIAAAYDPIASEHFNAMGGALFGKMSAYNMNPQTVADGIMALIQMKAGTRPLRYPLDAIAEGVDHEFINKRAEMKAKWQAQYSN